MASLRRDVYRPPVICLVCGVDSGPVRTFLIVFIGALVGASLLTMIWAWFSGRLSDDRKLARMPLEADNRETEENHA